MVELLRVDDRLLHGQVAFAWSKSLPINLIVIANDEVSQDKTAKATFALAKPAGMSLVISTVAKTVEFLRSPKAARYSALVLVNNMADAQSVAFECEGIDAVNLGGLREHDGSKRYTNAVCLSDEDVKIVRELVDKGISVFAQQVPADTKTDMASLIK